MITELLKMSACSLVDVLKNRDVKQSEILKDLENRRQEVDGFVNALPTTCFENALIGQLDLKKWKAKNFLILVDRFLGYLFQ